MRCCGVSQTPNIDRNCEEIQEAVKKEEITDLEASILSGESITKSNTL